MHDRRSYPIGDVLLAALWGICVGWLIGSSRPLDEVVQWVIFAIGALSAVYFGMSMKRNRDGDRDRS